MFWTRFTIQNLFIEIKTRGEEGKVPILPETMLHSVSRKVQGMEGEYSRGDEVNGDD